MRTRSKLLFAGLTAALLLSMAVAGASANRLSVSNRNFRVVWATAAGGFTQLVLNAEAGSNVTCNVTLEGSFHSATIAKVAGALVGFISRGTANTCSGGGATVLQETLPWHVRYRNFTGALPNIETLGVSLVNAGFKISNEVGTCTTRTTAETPATGSILVGAGGVVTGLRANEETRIPLRGSFGFCEAFAGEGSFSGTGKVTLLGTTTSLTVTLI